MFYSKIKLSLFIFIFLGPNFDQSSSFPLSFDLFPVQKENITLTQQLELKFQKERDGEELACSTVDTPSLSGLIDERWRWKGFFDVFVDPSYYDDERTLINNALARLAEVLPCLTFRMYAKGSTPSGDYVSVVNKSGCWSYVGMYSLRQELSLQNPGCMSMGTILHEFIHALGIHHEQNRVDRDDYVQVLYENVMPGTEINFYKNDPRFVSNFGVPYNLRSIMHYRSLDFSKNGEPTIVSHSGEPIGTTGEMMQTDIDKLRAMYKC